MHSIEEKNNGKSEVFLNFYTASKKRKTRRKIDAFLAAVRIDSLQKIKKTL